MSLYLKRYASPPLEIKQEPDANTDLILVIPVFNEPDLLSALTSLHICTLPQTHVEVIVVINESEESRPSVAKQNDKTYHEALQWVENNKRIGMEFYITKVKLPKKHAGVGLARKAGMDEAVRRFEKTGKTKGVILCYDADCTCEPTYLCEVYDTFIEEDLNGASIYYEHNFKELSDYEKDGIVQYELHLRYYVNALRSAGYPFAFHTVGSSMAVRSDIYQKAGGMNKRKAGEDFHFLHKIIPYGKFAEINTTTVYPSARVSTRVPFGTGKAMQTWLNNEMVKLKSYHPEIFDQLKLLLKAVPSHYRNKDIRETMKQLPIAVTNYLHSQEYFIELERMSAESPNTTRFIQKWFQWFNGLKALHFVHYLRDHHYSSQPVVEAASKLINKSVDTSVELLELYRKKDQEFKAAQIGLKHLYSEYQ